ncbi:beta-galactosidase [Parabacteroides sp. Marseille-P3160]|uniref:GH39 family glycosyl hydrolase n=1 Tax=Parabacteroides sp. Marseille-P3160 TaxID=1917887 RepID=UPI0009B96D1C|nr:beta-galactosidase [Parabacteroides sp. Marseille-P3160]
MNKLNSIFLFIFLFSVNMLAQHQDLSLTTRDKSLSEQQRKDPTIFADPALSIKQIGQLNMIPSHEIESSFLSIGFECLDREIFDPEKCYDKLGATGVKWARCQTGWNRCETVKGQYDFKWLDEVVDNLLQRGIQPWFNVGFGNRLYMPEAYDQAVGWVPLYFGDEVLKAWGNYIKALTEHFKGRVIHYELWNEPNINNFWQPGKANAPDYYKLISYTSDIIKKTDKKAKVGACVSGSLSGFVIDLIQLNVSEYIDFFAVHPYRIIPEKGYGSEIKSLRRLFDSNNGKHVELWQGEVGFGSYFPPKHFLRTWTKGSETLQAKWLLRRYAVDLSEGLKLSSFFQMVDMNAKEYRTSQGPQDPCLHGILHGKTYEPKESYYAISYFAALFDNKVQAKNLYLDINWSRRNPSDARVSRLQEVAVVTNSYEKEGYPVYLYYLPEDVQMQYPGMTGIDIQILADAPKSIKKPVLIDLLSGRVFSITDKAGDWQKGNAFQHVPLTDYPLVVTDLDAFKDRITLF